MRLDLKESRMLLLHLRCLAIVVLFLTIAIAVMMHTGCCVILFIVEGDGSFRDISCGALVARGLTLVRFGLEVQVEVVCCTHHIGCFGG